MIEWTPIIVALIVSTPGWLAWFSSRKNSKAIQEVHLSINSRMDELLKAAKGEATAAGREIGRKEGSA
jgi:hypothetical protein